jgi:hypothetical protein
MAKIGNKDIKKLSTWDLKELRKLKINVKNRLSSLNSKVRSVKDLPAKNILAGKEIGELNELLLSIGRAEKVLCK